MLMGLGVILGSIFKPEMFSFDLRQQRQANGNNSLPYTTTTYYPPASEPGGNYGYYYGGGSNNHQPSPSPIDYIYRTPSPVNNMDQSRPSRSIETYPPVSYTVVGTTNTAATNEGGTQTQESRVPTALHNFLIDTLSQVTDDKGVFLDPKTPQGKAYQWLLEYDDLQLIAEEVTPYLIQRIQQRYVLAALYFATGGQRLKTTWTACGAVPAVGSVIKNSFSIRCVFEDGESICADRHAFLNCSPDGDEEPVQRTEEISGGWNDVEGDEPDVHVDLEMDDMRVRNNVRSSATRGYQSRIDNNKNRDDDASKNDVIDGLTEKRWLSPISECEWFGVECNGDDEVSSLTLIANGLVGKLIPELASLTGLESLDLSHNALTDDLPNSLGKPESKLRQLSLSHNALEGTIPNSWFYTLTSMETFNVEHNKLSGTISSTLLPKWSATLRELLLSNNEFRGSLPPTLGRSRGLKILDVSNNKFEDGIPPEIGNLRQLNYLNLSGCKLRGSIPAEIGELNRLGKSNGLLSVSLH